MHDVRTLIIARYAEWTALSALRSGAPIKSRRDIYTLLHAVDFEPLFDESRGPITPGAFDDWHEATVAQMLHVEPRLNVGWAAKIINIYLKTRCYVANSGRPGLSAAIHPPVDGGLWLGLERRFADRDDIRSRALCVRRIKHIGDYDCYARVIEGCRLAAQARACDLIEVEQLWAGTEFGEEFVEESV